MTKLHELLAAEKTVTGAWSTILPETLKKMSNDHFFSGHTKTLSMIEDTPANAAIEAAARDHKALPTNVYDTLDYALKVYANAENLQADKNVTNASARADAEESAQVLELVHTGEVLALTTLANSKRHNAELTGAPR